MRPALWNRVASPRVPQTLLEATQAVEALQKGGQQDLSENNQASEVLEEVGVTRHTLARHTLILDMGLDTHIAEDIFQRRLSGNFLGASIATDESPPGNPRFLGLRFQITVLYLGFVKDKALWETSEDPPIATRSFLADICQCPGKTGEDLIKVLDKQLGRLGLSKADIVSGTRDGGGENEGRQGFHAILEGSNPPTPGGGVSLTSLGGSRTWPSRPRRTSCPTTALSRRTSRMASLGAG